MASVGIVLPGIILMVIGIAGCVVSPLLALMIKEDM